MDKKGFVICPRELLSLTQLTATDKVVYLVIAAHYNKPRKLCCPSISTIAQAVGLSEATVKRSRNNLKRQGVLTWTRGKSRTLYGSPFLGSKNLDGQRLCADSRTAHQRAIQSEDLKSSSMTPEQLTSELPREIDPENGKVKQDKAQRPIKANLEKLTSDPLTILTIKKNKSTVPPSSENGESAPLGEVGASPSPINAVQGKGCLMEARQRQARNLYRSITGREPDRDNAVKVEAWLQTYSPNQVRNMIKTMCST